MKYVTLRFLVLLVALTLASTLGIDAQNIPAYSKKIHLDKPFVQEYSVKYTASEEMVLKKRLPIETVPFRC